MKAFFGKNDDSKKLFENLPMNVFVVLAVNEPIKPRFAKYLVLTILRYNS